MRGALAVCRRELRSQLYQPTAWVVAGIFVFLAGWFFFNLVWQFAEIVRNYGLYAQMSGSASMGDRINVNSIVIEGFLSNVLVLFLFFLPALSMRTWAEERRQGTDELLRTAPVGPFSIVAGKYLALLLVSGGMLAFLGVFLGITVVRGDPEVGPILTGVLGLYLVLAALAALGLAVSTLTESQVLAAIGAFVVFLGLYVVAWPAEGTTGWKRELLRGLSLPSHFEGFTKGVVSSPDVVYFLSLAALGLFVARAAVASQRWR